MGGADRGASHILVLGGTGFIGGAITRQLANRPGLRVRVASRRGGLPVGVDNPVEGLRCDVLDPASLARALDGIDVVVNCCRERVNERESAHFIATLLDAVEAAGVRHLIYLSSIAAYGAATGTVDEDSDPVEPLHWYARAKRSAEAACLARTSDRLAVTLLRPSLVYGPGGAEWSLDFIRSIARGYLLGPGTAANGTANLVYVDDLAAYCADLASQEPDGSAMLIVNGIEQISFANYFAIIADALRAAGVTPRPQLRPPLFGAYARPLIQRGLGTLRRLGGTWVKPGGTIDRRITAAQIGLRRRPEDRAGSRYAIDVHYRPNRALAAGFAPSTTIAEGTRQAVLKAIADGLTTG